MTGTPLPPSEELRALLAQLDDALSRAEASDPETRAQLEALAERTREALESPMPPPPEARAELHSGLLGAIERFEGTHPDLAYALGKVADALSGLGI